MTKATRFRDFGSGRIDNEVEPITFALYGETFTCVRMIPGKLLLDLVADSQSEDAAKSAGIITKFFTRVLNKESRERFDILLEDTDRIVDVETLAEITGWLVEEFTNRPEAQSEAS
jgi:hypothetical protein